MKPLVSILIPAYNAERWLAETLQSVLAQTWSKIEIIVVDDGSKDHTLAVAKRFESASVKVIYQENQGQSAAENRALRAAQGDFIQYLDADDLLAPDKIERQLSLFKDGNLEYVASCEWSRFHKSPAEAAFAPQVPSKDMQLWRDIDPVTWLVNAWNENLMMHGAAWLISRRLIEQAGFWNEQLSLINDVDYFSRVLLSSQGVKFCQGARTYYRSGISGSLSGAKSDSAWRSGFLSIQLASTNLLAREDNPKTRRACAALFQRFIYEAYPAVPELRAQARTRVQELGGSDLKPQGSPTFHLLSSLIGWQQTKRLQNLVYAYGYQKVAFGRLFASNSRA